MEHLALELLYDRTEEGRVPSALADELAGQFKEIMIDEYQDSNGVQEALLKALSAELQPFKEIHITHASATICAHCGPNTTGILFITK